MRGLRHWLAIARHLSLDVCIGSLGSAALVAGLWGVRLTPHVLILPVAVWLIYTLDHLLDAHRIPHEAHTLRHRFHQGHFRPLLGAWLVGALLAGLYVVGWMPHRLLRMGFAVLGLTLLHLVIVGLVRGLTGPWLWKEVAVATIYTLGVAVAPASLLAAHTSAPDWLGAALRVLPLWTAAALNLLGIGWFEAVQEKADGQSSLAQVLAPSTLRGLMVVLLVLGLSVSVLFRWAAAQSQQPSDGLPFALLALVNLWQIVPLIWPRWFAQHERYRWWGDFGFWWGLLCLR